MTEAELFAVCDEHFRAEYEGDLEATMATIAPNPHFIIYPLDMHLTTREQVRDYYKGLYEAGFTRWDSHTVGRWAVDDRTVIVETTVHMTVGGNFLGMKIEGKKKISLPQIDILTIENGLITGERVYFDLGSIHRQLAS